LIIRCKKTSIQHRLSHIYGIKIKDLPALKIQKKKAILHKFQPDANRGCDADRIGLNAQSASFFNGFPDVLPMAFVRLRTGITASCPYTLQA